MSNARVDTPFERHGGDVVGFELRYGRLPRLDFSACVNPLGISPRAQEAIRDAACHADRYPDPRCSRLRAAIARHEGVDFESVACGNGAADVIERIVRAVRPRRALVCAPTFCEYEAALRACGCDVVSYPLPRERSFLMADDIFEAAAGCELVFACEPNNPTGALDAPELLEDLLSWCEGHAALLVVDECFNGLTQHARQASMRSRVVYSRNLIVIDAFTKLYGMAGVRLGYALCGDAALAARIASCGTPWAVSTLAQAAGIAALEDEEHVRESLRFLAREMPRFARGLEQLGLTVYRPQANFVLCHHERADIASSLAREGVYVRDCSTYAGLGAGDVRIGVRTPAENDELLAVLGRVLEAGRS